MLRIGIVEDHELLRALIASSLDGCGEYEVEKFSSAEDVLGSLAREHRRKDLWVLDYRLPGMNGAVLGAHLANVDWDCRLLMLSDFISSALLQAVPIETRHRWSFVNKRLLSEEVQFREVIAASLRLSFSQMPASSLSDALTTSDLRLLSLLCLGHRSESIAQIEKVSIKTVEARLRSLYTVLKLPAGGAFNQRILAAGIGWSMGLECSSASLMPGSDDEGVPLV